VKIFLCWSGERSKQFATAASQFLKTVFDDAVDTEISIDIQKGSVWFDDLSDALRQARVGLLCLTSEAVGSPWIHFEAGILAKALHDRLETVPPAFVLSAPPVRRSASLRIFPFLYGADASLLKGPLTAYQSTLARDRDDVWRLVETVQLVIDEEAGTSPDAESERTRARERRIKFETAWPELTARLAGIKPAKLTEIVPDFESLFRRKTFDESMYDCLNQGWLARYDGARSVETRLRAAQRTVREACDRYVADMFDALIADVSAYAMVLAVQVAEPPSTIDAQGKVAFQQGGVAAACERYRIRIKELVARLIDEQQVPMFQEAFQFEASETSVEKKRVILRKAADIRQRRTAFSEEMDAPIAKDNGDGPQKKHRCRDSDWDFDRIAYYMWVEETWADMHLSTHLHCVRTELEREAAGAVDPFRLSLAYALRVIAKGLPKTSDVALLSEARALHQRIAASIPSAPADGLADLRQGLNDVLAALEAVASSVPDPTA
jgi:hypothetical protein